MKPIIDVEQWRRELEASFTRTANAVAEYLPLVIGAIVILLVGWLIARVAGSLISWILRRAGFDRGVSRLRLTETLQRAGIASTPSHLVGRLTFWVLLLAFARAALDVLALSTLSATVDRLVAYLPSMISAGLIILFGFLLARLARNLVTSAAATVKFTKAEPAGGVTYVLVILVTSIVALERLGLDTQIFVTLLTALVATFGLTMGLSFALGAKPLVTHILAGHFLRQRLPRDAIIEVLGHRGTVVRVGSLDTVIKEGDREWSFPNAQLMDEIMAR